jgi:large subunit ribosomal protein L10
VAKVVSKFAKDHEALKIMVGVMNGDLIDKSTIQMLAKLPGRDELLATLMATMNAPLEKFVRTLNEVPGKLVRTMAAYRDSRQAELA